MQDIEGNEFCLDSVAAVDRFLVSRGYCPGGIAPMTVRVTLLFRYDTLNR
jgi:hypothetical protein